MRLVIIFSSGFELFCNKNHFVLKRISGPVSTNQQKVRSPGEAGLPSHSAPEQDLWGRGTVRLTSRAGGSYVQEDPSLEGQEVFVTVTNCPS